MRRALLALVVVAALSLTVSIHAFDSVTAERGVSVSIVDDDEAYVAVDTCQSGSEGLVNVTVTNRFDTEVDVVRIVPDGSDDVRTVSDLDPGERRTVDGVRAAGSITVEVIDDRVRATLPDRTPGGACAGTPG